MARATAHATHPTSRRAPSGGASRCSRPGTPAPPRPAQGSLPPRQIRRRSASAVCTGPECSGRTLPRCSPRWRSSPAETGRTDSWLAGGRLHPSPAARGVGPRAHASTPPASDSFACRHYAPIPAPRRTHFMLYEALSCIGRYRAPRTAHVSCLHPPAMRLRHPLVLASACIGYFMAVLDSTVVNVALPDMARSLGTGIAGMQWVVDGYALLFASLLLTAGALGDRLGNRGTFVAGLALFTLASLLCGIAPNLGTLIAFRALQGVGAAVQVPAALALLRHAYHDPAERAQAIGIWAAATGLAVAAGPVVGGILTHAWTWRSVFLVNLPVGVLGILLTLRHVPPVPPHHDGELDIKAQVLGIVALGALTFGLIQGGVWGWSSAPVILALLVAIASGVLFYRGERSAEHPMLPPALFRDLTFSAANAVGAILSFGFYGELFLMSLFFQQVQHRSPLATGLALLPQTAVISLMNFVSGQITARRGARLPMVVGLGIGGSGLVGLALVSATAPLASAVGPMLAMGVGASLAMPAMTHAAIDHTPKERAGIGSAVLNASRQVGGVIGIALLGALISSHARRGATAHFMLGLHQGLALAGVLFLAGSGLSLAFVERSKR